MKLFNVPNTLTLLNLFSGCVAIILLLIPGSKWTGSLVGFFVLISLIADYLDGTMARVLNQKSDIGKELDSLADMVSFGLLPGILIFKIIFTTYFTLDNTATAVALGSIGMLIPLFSALRLAKFNIDTRQTENFIGLATPANTIFWLGIFYAVFFNQYSMANYLCKLSVLVPMIIISAYLLIAELPMFSFKFKNFSWQENKLRFIFIGVAIAELLLTRFIGFSLVILTYIIFSLFSSFQKNKI